MLIQLSSLVNLPGMVAMLACGYLAVAAAAVAAGPDGVAAADASCSEEAVAQEVDRNLCTCPCGDFGVGTPVERCNFCNF